ncbi:MAG: sulfurtransferase [Cellvibrio sp. 79]|nr:MAG: sulfurtransferase [Cellvibrio sp. 79]
MKKLTLVFGVFLAFFASVSFAQNNSSKPAVKYKTPELTVAQVDQWLAKPDQVLIIDIRRPDELITFGSFPVFLNVQFADLEKNIAYIPKDRSIITVSNHANRAFAAGDLLSSKGYKVIGAAGSENYEQQGGKAVTKIQKPAPKPTAAN